MLTVMAVPQGSGSVNVTDDKTRAAVVVAQATARAARQGPGPKMQRCLRKTLARGAARQLVPLGMRRL